MSSTFKAFGWFYALTFLLLGLIPLLDMLFGGAGLDFQEAASRATAATGLEWNSNLLVVIRLSLAEPSLLLLLVGSLVPALAAVIVLGFVRRPGKWRSFFGRLNPVRGVSVGTAALLYLSIFAILTPVLILVLNIRQFTGGDYVISEQAFGLSIVPALLAIAFLDQGAVLEELGWRGFATSELQDNGVSPLWTAILIGICWGLWHLPRDITTGVIDRLGMIDYLLMYLPSFVLGTVAVSIIASFFMNRLGGSLIPAIVVHGLTNDAIGLSGTASIVEALTPYHQITKNLPLALIAIAIVVYSRGGLGLPDISLRRQKFSGGVE